MNIDVFQGLIIAVVLYLVGRWLFLKAARRTMKPQPHEYFTSTDCPAAAPQQLPAHSHALDVASNPWVYGGEHDPRSHAYAAKQYCQREAVARSAAYKNEVKRSERTRKLNKWKVTDE